jgi:hypothetical protein
VVAVIAGRAVAMVYGTKRSDNQYGYSLYEVEVR